MKLKRTLRKEFPRVLQYLRQGRTIYVVDCRSRLYGTKKRHVRATESKALKLHSEIREKLRVAAKPIAESSCLPNLTAALKKLEANGGSLHEAVEFWIKQRALEVEQSLQPTVECLCKEWMAGKLDNTLNKISEKTAAEIRSYGGWIVRIWGGRKVAEITDKEIEKTLENIEVQNITKRQYLRYLKMFLKWVMERKRLISELPTKFIEIKVAPKPIRIYPPQQIQTMWQIVSSEFQELKSWFLICNWAGLRPSECARLTWEDVCFSTNQISVNDEGKTGARFVTAEKALVRALQGIHAKNSDQPLIPSGLERRLKLLRKRIQKQQIEWIQDGLRHTCVSFYYAKHKSWDLVEFNFGHSSQTSKQFYKKAVPEAVTTEFWNLLNRIADKTL